MRVIYGIISSSKIFSDSYNSLFRRQKLLVTFHGVCIILIIESLVITCSDDQIY